MAAAEAISSKLGLFRFDAGQVQMSQEDNIRDASIAEKPFGPRMRDFEEELAAYADRIP